MTETMTALLAAQHDAGTALIERGQRTSFAELDEMSRRLARGLHELGVRPGDRVAIWLPNCVAYAALYFACCRLGAIAVAVNTRFRSVEVEDIIGRAGCKALVFWPGFKGIDFAGILRGVRPQALAALETVIVYDEDGGRGHERAPTPGARSVAYRTLLSAAPLEQDLARPDSPCNIFTTSGTTKAPKFVLHKQSAIAAHGRAVAAAFGYRTPETVLLQATPFCGVFGFSQLAAAVAAGRPSVLMPLFDGAEALRLIGEHRVTDMNGGDEMMERMLAASPAERPMPGLRFYGYGQFNPALADIVERAAARGVTMLGLYGMSELLALFSLQPPAAPPGDRRLAGGIPVSPQARVRARDRTSGRILPHGETGELEISGPSVMVGYFGNPQATQDAFTEDGFLRTGDLGYTFADGSFVFLSRLGDVLRLGGFLVNPAEIEAHLLDHPAVDGCQVVGVELPSGPAAVAFVTLRSGAAASEQDLRDHCKAGLAGYKVPARVFQLEAFPIAQSANGPKVQRNKLRELAQHRLAEPADTQVAIADLAARPR